MYLHEKEIALTKTIRYLLSIQKEQQHTTTTSTATTDTDADTDAGPNRSSGRGRGRHTLLTRTLSVPTATATATAAATPADVSKNTATTKNVNGTNVHDAIAKRQYNNIHNDVDTNAILQTKKGRKKKMKLQRQQQRKQGVHHHKQVPIQLALPYEATKVSYGFKAPVTLLLLPVLISLIEDHIQLQQRKQLQQQVTNANHNTSKSNHNSNSNRDNNNNSPKVKFIHVVRDGRDVALSSNQSPVHKFYNVTYPNDYQQRHQLYTSHTNDDNTIVDLHYVRAMQLWNDWNIQTRAWALSHPNQVDYLLIRMEDLVSTSDGGQTRYATLMALADFVGSPRPPNELCCLSQKKSKDYGKSAQIGADGNGNKEAGGGALESISRLLYVGSRPRLPPSSSTVPKKDVNTRYGKWQQVLENNQRLSDYFYQEGQEGLQLFGYHPYTDIHYNHKSNSSVIDNGNDHISRHVSSTTTTSSSSPTMQQQQQQQQQQFVCIKSKEIPTSCSKL